jgi:hypothetical protein
MMLSAMAKKNSIQKALKFAFSGYSLFFIGMLFFIVIYDVLTVHLHKQQQNIVLNMAF